MFACVCSSQELTALPTIGVCLYTLYMSLHFTLCFTHRLLHLINDILTKVVDFIDSKKQILNFSIFYNRHKQPTESINYVVDFIVRYWRYGVIFYSKNDTDVY
jgi:hypothetical protein